MQTEANFASNWSSGSRTQVAAVQKADTWATTAIQIGISFLAAMTVAGLLRTFFKSMLTLIVIAVVTLLVLQHKGIVDPFWEGYLTTPDNVTDWAANETVSLWEKIKDIVPSSGFALAGFAFGLKR
jgi:uncharacterized membrane protein (Fun14 family)